MSEENKIVEEIVEKDEVEPVTPIEVIVKKEETKEEPDYDYDNYLPSDDEIIETEKEIVENFKKRMVKS